MIKISISLELDDEAAETIIDVMLETLDEFIEDKKKKK